MKVEEYIESLPEPSKSQINHLHHIITSAVPKLSPKIWHYSGVLIGYGKYHYKTKSGREGEWFPIGLALRKNYISLYSTAVKNGKYLTEYYKDRLPGTNIGKSCINIYKPEILDENVVAELCKETYELMKGEIAKKQS